MLFRIAEKKEIRALYDMLAEKNAVVGPVRTGSGRNGAPLFAFEQVSSYERLDLGYTTTRLPAKRYFLPFREDLATFKVSGKDWTKTIDYNIERPYVLFGLHACDINALNKLDKVLIGEALDELIEALITEHQAALLAEMEGVS